MNKRKKIDQQQIHFSLYLYMMILIFAFLGLLPNMFKERKCLAKYEIKFYILLFSINFSVLHYVVEAVLLGFCQNLLQSLNFHYIKCEINLRCERLI